MRFLKRLVLLTGLVAGVLTLSKWRRRRQDEEDLEEALAGADE